MTIVDVIFWSVHKQDGGEKAQKDANFQVFPELVKNVLHYEEW